MRFVRPNYSFQSNPLSRNRIALYIVVLAIFVFAAVSIASYTNPVPSESSSGYILTKQDKQDQPDVGEQANKISGVSRIDDVQNQLDKLKFDINLFSSNLTTCYQATSDLSNQIQSCNTDVTACKTDLLKLNTNKSLGEQTCLSEKTGLGATITSLQLQSEDMNRTLTALSATYDSLKKEYEAFSLNIGNNICCKARVDNLKIKFYRVENSKIVCSEDTGTPISCQ